MVKMNEKLCNRLGGEWYEHHKEYGDNACAGIDLSGSNLPKTNLSNTDLYKSNISNSDLWWVNLSNSHLDGAHLTNADLGDADLSNVDFFRANFSNSKLTAIKRNEKAIKSLLEIHPSYLEGDKKQIEKNRDLIRQELLLSGV